MFVDTFIKRPILASVCSLVIVLAGALAIPNMPIAWYPDVTPPTMSVTAVYTGANSETVETAVTTPLEQAINGVEGMLYLTSTSSSGTSTITVTFRQTGIKELADVKEGVVHLDYAIRSPIYSVRVEVRLSAARMSCHGGAPGSLQEALDRQFGNRGTPEVDGLSGAGDCGGERAPAREENVENAKDETRS